MTYLIVASIARKGKLSSLHNNPTDFVKKADDILGSKKFYKDLAKAAAKDTADTIRKYLKNKK